jgi:cytoskeletal protein RodZ
MLSNAQKNKLLLAVIAVAAIGVGSFVYLSGDNRTSPPSTPPQHPEVQPKQVENMRPPPSTAASRDQAETSPSTHQHNTQETPPSASPAQKTQRPPGPAPEGKVWSAEHGHWHNAPGSTPTTPKQPVPQPPVPAPEGKIWSPEHGHWHDAPNIKIIDKKETNQPDSK